MKRVLMALATMVALPAGAASYGPYSEIVAFGDSLSDSGNVAAVTTASGGTFAYDVYPLGQFTNGNTWATQLGLAPSLLGGSNFSYGGARALTNGDSVPDLKAQIKQFLGSGLDTGDNPLATIWIGGNDFLALPDDASDKKVKKKIRKVVRKIAKGVKKLYKSGIDDFLVLGLPDFSMLPDFAEAPERASFLTAYYNNKLAKTLDRLDRRLRGATVDYFDVNSVFSDVIADVPPELISVPCLADPLGCAQTPTDYLLYDSIHPSFWVHAALADAVGGQIGATAGEEVSAVPLPATAPLLLAAFGGLAIWSRRRRSPA